MKNIHYIRTDFFLRCLLVSAFFIIFIFLIVQKNKIENIKDVVKTDTLFITEKDTITLIEATGIAMVPELTKITRINNSTVKRTSPSFIGGEVALQNYIKSNFKFNNIEDNKFCIIFTVKSTGKVTDPFLLNNWSDATTQTILEFIYNMPNWVPGKEGDVFVDKQVILLIKE